MGFYCQPHVAESDRTPETVCLCPQLSLPGLRYYSPTQGRWFRRDPDGEFRYVAYVDATVIGHLSAASQDQRLRTQKADGSVPAVDALAQQLPRIYCGTLAQMREQLRSDVDAAAGNLDRGPGRARLSHIADVDPYGPDSAGLALWRHMLIQDCPTLYPFLGNRPVDGVDPDGEMSLLLWAGAILGAAGCAAWVLDTLSNGQAPPHDHPEPPALGSEDPMRNGPTQRCRYNCKGELCEIVYVP